MSRVRRKQNLRTTAVVFMMVVIVIIGFMVAGNQMRQPRQQTVQYTYPLPPSNQPPTEQKQQGGILESLSNLFKPVAESLGLSTAPTPGSEPVGLDAEFGITSSSGESLIFTKNVLSGVYIGEIGFAGVYIKPSLGSGKPLKLYDENYPEYEGEIWVKPVVNVRVFNGTVKAHSFTVKLKVAVDGAVVDERKLVKEGSGPPPMRIEMDKASIKGRDIHQILRAPKGKPISVGKGVLKEAGLLQSAIPVVEGRQVCFYADYEGLVIFEDPVTGEDYPVYRKLENANMGCFDFAVAETGDFEMKVSRNQTTAPVAEVMIAGYQELEKLVTTTRVLTYTVTTGTTYTKTTTVTLYAGSGKSSGSSGDKTATTENPPQTTTQAQAYEWPTPPNCTPEGYCASAVTLVYPYSQFIFIGRG